MRTVGGRKGPNFTCIMAVSNTRGLIHTEFRDGGTNGAVFVNFLEEVSMRLGDMPATFVFDNAPCHRGARNAVLYAQHVLRFLPPYSPFLNIVENAWSAWKAALKAELAEARAHIIEMPFQERLAALIQLGEQNLNVITLYKIQAWYRKTTTYIHRCLNFEDFLQDHA